MPTPASQMALEGLRDLTTLKWYVIPLLAIVFYIYTVELQKARRSGNWDAIYAGLTLFGMDFINETWNGWVFHFTQHSAFWTTPGPTALRTMIGWNIEIMFMFSIAGIAWSKILLPDPKTKILGIPNRAFARTHAPFKTIYLAPVGGEAELSWADYLWVTPEMRMPRHAKMGRVKKIK